MRIKLVNNFHSTEARLNVTESKNGNMYVVTKSQYKRALSKLCGIKGCCCGNNQQNFTAEEVHNNDDIYYIYLYTA